MKLGIRFVLLALTYLAFAGQTSADECVAAALSAAMLVWLSLFARNWQTVRFRFVPVVVLGQVLAALPLLVSDSARLVPRILRGGWHTGTMSQEFVHAAADQQDNAWWAVFTLTTSLPPNSYLITRLARPREVVIHRLVA